MDNDLAESVSALQAILKKRLIPAAFSQQAPEAIVGIEQRLNLPHRYVSFLKSADPSDVESVTPTERVRFISANDLEREQIGYGVGDGENPATPGWRKEWVVFAHSAMLGDPYFLDTSRADAEGDCPVMTAMSGANLQPVVCASGIACFIRILATAMEIAEDFSDDSCDPDDEHIFREALGRKLRAIDPIALRSRHWSN